MKRREAILTVTALMGGALSTPALGGLLYGSRKKILGNSAGVQVAISDNQKRMIGEIAELIIPTTSTPGAKAAKVPEFINLMVADCYSEKDQQYFLAGLDKFDNTAKSTYAKGFLACSQEQQIELLKKAEAESIAQRNTAGTHFFRTMKELTLLGYFTSEIGATQALDYVHIPGRYDGNMTIVPGKPGAKGWAL
ncbi:gluconate 2-dehydrogenase subunit 3 family protein [Adhaeribacter aquaticus]|uniref:gluconate 2-dehydrogenase subunit 3 family protein n=1 Tax=Adhaeribacter aquaticus TaxID=299567 RepID=UPI00047A0E68|nr:gluconate 2-dehydrogenase subunit 3 family protein [Adhaeribacter aquaticus]